MSGAVIKIEGVPELVRTLQAESLIGKPMRTFFSSFGQIAKGRAASAAPVRTGRLQASLTRRLDSKPIPRFVAISATAKNAKSGYPYGKALEYGPRFHHVGWMRTAVEGAMGEIGSLLSAAAADIEAQFRGK